MRLRKNLIEFHFVNQFNKLSRPSTRLTPFYFNAIKKKSKRSRLKVQSLLKIRMTGLQMHRINKLSKHEF